METDEEISYRVRMPSLLREEIRGAAKASGRSMNAEIVHRLEQSEKDDAILSVLIGEPRLQTLFRELAVVRDHVTGLADSRGWTDADKAGWIAYLQLAAHLLRYRLEQTVASGDSPSKWPRIGPDDFTAVVRIMEPTPANLVTMYRERIFATPEEMRVICQSLLTGLPQLAHDLAECGADRSFAEAETGKLRDEILDRFPHLANDTEEEASE